MRYLLVFGAALLLHADATHPFFATYLGGGGNEIVGAVATDSHGNIYIAGRTDSSDFPVKNAIQAASRAFSQIFIARFSPAGEMLYSTYFGGSDNDLATAIAVDQAGNLYLTGAVKSHDFPIANAFQANIGGQVDAFVLKLDPNGKTMYSTYLGGRFNDFGMAIAVDAQGNAYVTGRTESPDFPVTPGVWQERPAGYTPGYTFVEAFVTRLDPAGRPVYSTFLGSGESDVGWSIAVDGQGQAHVAGETYSRAFPVTANAMQPEPGRSSYLGDGTTDGFLTKLNAGGTALVYSTYLGGPGQDVVRSVALDAAGNAYVTGLTTDGRLPIVNGPRRYLGTDIYLVSSDGGASFTPRRSGLAAGSVRSIVFDPNSAGTVYAGTAQGVFRSPDGGETWNSAGLANQSILQLAVHPARSGTLYAGISYGGGLFRSTDGGDTWISLAAGYPGDISHTTVKALAVDPSGAGVVYVCAGSAGNGVGLDQPIFRVEDDGARWTLLGQGLRTAPASVAVASDSTVFAGTLRFDWVSLFGTSGLTHIPGTVYRRSTDGWVNAGLDDDIHALAVQGGTLFAAGQKFYRSTDGGQTWTGTPLPAGPTASQIALDARNPTNVFILPGGPSADRLLHSIDGGQNFDVIQSRPLQAIAVNPFDSTLHAGMVAAPDGFVAGFDPAGGLIYSTFLGQASAARGDSLALDGAGNIYVAGYRDPGHFIGYDGTGFVAKIGQDLDTIDLGGSTTATVLNMPSRALTIAPDGAIVAVMIATQRGLPAPNAVQAELNGASDIYLIKWYPQ